MKQVDNICFTEFDHKYTNVDTAEIYTSITTWLSRFKRPFKGTTTSTEARTGMTHKEVLDLWEVAKVEASTRGKLCHTYIELLLLNAGLFHPTALNEEVSNILTAIKTIKDRYENFNDKMRVEELVYSHTHKLAGQSDLIIDDGDFIDVYDWKTNQKDIKSVKDKYCKKLVNIDLPNCALSEYFIQLCAYGILYAQMHKKKLRDVRVVHIFNEVKEYTLPKELRLYICSTIYPLLKNYE